MKKSLSLISAAILGLSASACSGLFSIEEPESDYGEIALSFSESAASLRTKSAGDIPDTNNFILRVYNSAGKVLYNGKYGASPKTISAEEGNCTVEILSREFSAPLFDAPQYGDTRTVAVKAGETTSVRLECTLLNCGVRLRTAPDFLEAYPLATLVLRSTDGTLMYSYSERRTAYFRPGTVSLVLSSKDEDRTLLSRSLNAREILTLNVSAGTAAHASKGISVSIDTSAVHSSEDFVIDSGGRGSSKENAFNVTQVRMNPGLSDVWVYGYIVGGDLSSSKCSFDPPFSSKTNIVLATRSSCRDRSECISVQLSKGDIREELNLVDHPENLGREVMLLGDIVPAYYGLPGVQAILEYCWKE